MNGWACSLTGWRGGLERRGFPSVGILPEVLDNLLAASGEDSIYFANGSKAFPKERLEVFCAGRVLQLDNFHRLRGYAWPGFSNWGMLCGIKVLQRRTRPG
jgi:hypothetical protein